MFMLRLNFINKPKLTSPFRSNLNESDSLKVAERFFSNTHECVHRYLYPPPKMALGKVEEEVCVCPSWWAQTAGRDGTDREENTWTVHSVKLGADSQARRAASEYTHAHTVKFKVREVQTESL